MKHGIFLMAVLSILAACNPNMLQPTSIPIPSFTPAPILTPTSTPTESSTPTALTFKNPDGTLSTYTVTPDGTVTPIESPTPEIVEYPICTDPEKFRDCVIPPDALLDGSYVKFLKDSGVGEKHPFDKDKLKIAKLVRWYDEEDVVVYSGSNPIYNNVESRPYHRDVYGFTEFEGIKYFVSPVQFYVEGLEPKDYPWIIAVFPIFDDKKGVDLQIRYWLTEMNFPAWITKSKSTITRQTFDNPDIQKKIDGFVAGDPKALDGKIIDVNLVKSKYYK